MVDTMVCCSLTSPFSDFVKGRGRRLSVRGMSSTSVIKPFLYNLESVKTLPVNLSKDTSSHNKRAMHTVTLTRDVRSKLTSISTLGSRGQYRSRDIIW